MEPYEFRGWDNKNKKMWLWHELLKDPQILRSFFGNEMHPTNPPTYFWERMQYIGMHDENEVKIYPRDVILLKSISTKRHLVVPDMHFSKSYKWIKLWESVEVLGNIYTDPDLRKLVEEDSKPVHISKL